jgi:hypothetical protein
MVDEWHRAEYLRPVSAETLRQRLRIGAWRSRLLVATIRAELRDGRTLPDSLGERSPAVASPVEGQSEGRGPDKAVRCRRSGPPVS